MLIRKAFKFELTPNREQAQLMRQFAGACRFVYNKALALQKERYKRGEKKLTTFELTNLLPIWKAEPEMQWLSDVHAQMLQQVMKDLDRAYTNFFSNRADSPRFKKKGLNNSFRYPQNIKLDQGGNQIYLPKIGWCRYRNSRLVEGKIKNVTVSQNGDKWFAAIQTEFENDIPTPNGDMIGIDMGIARFATLSDGSFYEPRNSFKTLESALRKAQQAMSRKVKFSNNWKKTKSKLQRIHAKISNCRRDYLHKTSSDISKNHAIVCIEDLQVKNMSKSAAGTVENPGKNMKAKSGLNKAILDQGWGEFRRQLDYKLLWRGGYLIAVPPKNTSRTCPCCGHISKDNRMTQARFSCVKCGFEENADVVGAINVLRAGHAQLACEVSGALMPPAAGT